MSISTPSPRIDAAVAAFHGEQTAVLEDVLDESRIDVLSETNQTRLTAALEESICVFPEREGLYRVWSRDGEDETEYTVDMKYPDAKTCTCGDFMFRLDAREGQMCKHMWRTILLLRAGALPEPDRDPYDWLLDEIARDVRLLRGIAKVEDDVATRRTAAEMDALLSATRETHRIAIEYPRVCRQRAEVLSTLA